MKNETVIIRIEPHVKQAWEQLAKAEDMSLAAWIRKQCNEPKNPADTKFIAKVKVQALNELFDMMGVSKNETQPYINKISEQSK